ncbi:MAG TPA: M20/M25/M40 family metallo-hydrolase [Terriglobales bacterium]|nr:M20/M25/M40 family metallo-hydrolase [Terriglobales bacterium]
MVFRRHSAIARLAACAALAILIAPAAARAAGPNGDAPDLEMITAIRQEGFKNSQVMNILSDLTDRIGPRLTGSPNMKKANEWTRDEFTKWGLQNSHLESWGPFGLGWQNQSTFVRMTAPDTAMLMAYPEAWTPGTNGLVKGEVVSAKLEKSEDLQKYRGKLTGKIVLLGDPREIKPGSDPDFTRYTDKELADLAEYHAGPEFGRQFNREDFLRRAAFRKELAKFWADEKPLAVIEDSRGEDGTIFVSSGGPYQKDQPPTAVPMLTMAGEHFGRLYRLVEHKVPVELEIDVKNQFTDGDPMQYNTVAEIPGTDPALKDQIVMLGAHLDSWHSGTGATDNAAGSAVMMEAVRILEALKVKPRRTIRIALWSGEEEGLLGSRAYCAQHFGSRPEPDASQRDIPSFLRRETGPLTLKPEQTKVSGYFNVDNGTGKIRGIYLQENAAVRPIFEQWLQPFSDLGAGTITMRNTGGTDHLSFDAVGIPGFQFIQDPMDYGTRTHHSNMDVYERVQPQDMMDNAVIVATFVYETAQRDQMLPRKPLPPNTIAAATETAPAAEKTRKAKKGN